MVSLSSEDERRGDVLMCCDVGLHLSPAGYKVVYGSLISLIKEKWPEFPPGKM